MRTQGSVGRVIVFIRTQIKQRRAQKTNDRRRLRAFLQRGVLKNAATTFFNARLVISQVWLCNAM